MQPLDLLLCLSQETRRVYRVPVTCRQERFQAHIYPYLLSGRNMHNMPICFHRKLHIVPICPFHQTYPLYLFDRKRHDNTSAYHAESPDSASIREGDVTPVCIEFPSRLFVLNAAVIVPVLAVDALTPALPAYPSP